MAVFGCWPTTLQFLPPNEPIRKYKIPFNYFPWTKWNYLAFPFSASAPCFMRSLKKDTILQMVAVRVNKHQSLFLVVFSQMKPNTIMRYFFTGKLFFVCFIFNYFLLNFFPLWCFLNQLFEGELATGHFRYIIYLSGVITAQAIFLMFFYPFFNIFFLWFLFL